MGVQGVFQRMTKYAGPGIIVGGSLYYGIKENSFFNLRKGDHLKDSYHNLKNAFQAQKMQDYCSIISENAIPIATFGIMPNLHLAHNAPNQYHSDTEYYYPKSQATSKIYPATGLLGAFSTLQAEEQKHKELTHDKIKSLVSKVPILENLTEAERHIVADALVPVTFKKGDIIMKQGDPGEDFFIIIEGNVVCTQYARKGETAQEVGHLGANDYFGEIALLLNQPRRATVTVVSHELTCVRLDKKGFETVMGPCSNILRRSIQNYSSAISLKLSMPSF